MARSGNIVAVVAVILSTSSLIGARAADPDVAGSGWGESYWGIIPPPADTTVAVFDQERDPTWQYVVDLPYEIIGFPVQLVTGGIGATVVFLDENGLVRRLGRLLAPRELPFGLVLSGSAGGLTGLGGGATIVHDAFFGSDNRFRLGGKGSTNGNVRAIVGMQLNAGHGDELQLGAGYRVQPNARFFGIGPATREGDESRFRKEMAWAGGSYRRALGWNFALEPRALYSTVHARGPREDEDHPALAEAFPGDLTPRGYRNRSDGWAFELGLDHDDARETGRPETGGYRRVAATYFTSTDEETFDFWTYRAEIQQFIPLWFSKRALALRAFYSWIDAEMSEMPFQRLMTNDDPDLLRGYRDFRWTDRGMVAFTAEYRWPLWAASTADGSGLDAYLFTDIGQVFGDSDQITAENLTYSYGGGARLVGGHGFTGRIEIGASEEEVIFRVRADQVFQFEKGDLYHGRNPIPFR